MSHNLEALRENFYKYMAWVSSSGIHGKKLYKAVADFWLSKFSELERKIEKLYENEEARRRTYYPIDPPPHDHYWGNKMVDKYQEALSDVLKLFNREK